MGQLMRESLVNVIVWRLDSGNVPLVIAKPRSGAKLLVMLIQIVVDKIY